MQTMKVNNSYKITKMVKFDSLKPEEKYTVREDATAIISSQCIISHLNLNKMTTFSSGYIIIWKK